MPYKIKYIKYLLISSFITLICSFSASAQLIVTPTSTAASLAAKLAGPGITIISDTLVCNTLANGTFVVGPTTTPIGIDSGIILSSGKASATAGPEAGVTSTSFSAAGDADVTTLMGGGVSRDACALIINFVPKGDTVSFRYQFGSEEYISAVCGPYNDAFGFFIAGPGISASYPGVNMALVPGTTIPVAVNSINIGTSSGCGGCNFNNCTSMGAGSPFTAYYINNAGGTQVSFRGYTTVLTAKHHVTPCDTYRIKMVVADGGTSASPNYIYDSGVFIEAGSLKTNTYHFDLNDSIGSTVLGVPHTLVKGCGTDTFSIKSAYTVPFATTLNLTYTGTAVSGTDYSPLPVSVVIPAGDSVVKIPVTALPTPPSGTKTIGITLTSANICGIIDTLSLTIIDHPSAILASNDSTICLGSSTQLLANGTPGLAYNWSPASSLNNPAIASPIATPTATTTYVMNATLQGAHCPAITYSVTISTFSVSATILTPDTTICQGDQFTIRVNSLSSYIFSWSPPAGLDNPTVKDPVAHPAATTTYLLTTSVAGLGCPVTNQITVTVIPTDFTISTIDTYLCEGYTINLNALVTPVGAPYTYLWSGPNGYSSFLQNPIITTATSLHEGLYFLTVTNAGGCAKSATEHITVFPVPNAPIEASDLIICQYAPPLPLLVPHYENLMWYSSASDTTPSVFAPYPYTDSIGTFIFYTSQISLKSNCVGPKQPITVKVENCCNGTIHVPSAFTPNGDGHNDVLKVLKSGDYMIDDFSVYDRWGVLVFRSTNDKPSWDGTFNGVPADMGQYFYYLVVNCTNSDKHPIMLKGDVTLIR